MRAEDINIDIEKLKDRQKKNAEDRLKFIEMYAEWVRKNSNATWSKQQNMLINSQIRSAKQWAKKKE
ncbi:MAG: hypothetical protein HY513_04830 [Candidatus Aenigmarchaeota archaeon]|nr:hypothetical protein [Candidatus Aenigmarchaeota archaeon]